MRYALLRSATAILSHGGRTVLIDPMLDQIHIRDPGDSIQIKNRPTSETPA